MAVIEREQLKPATDSERWRLRPAVNPWVVGLVLLAALYFSWSAQRNGLDKLPGILGQAGAEAVGLAHGSEVGPAIHRLVTGLLPPTISEKIDVSRVDNFDPKHLPPFTHIVREPIREYSIETRSWTNSGERDFLYSPTGYLQRVLLLMLQTIEIAIWGTLLALILAIPLAFWGARNLAPNGAAYAFARGWTSFTRSMPEMISALILVTIFGLGAVPGILALAFSTSGFLGKFLAEDIENADRGPQEALRCLGANKWKVLRYAILPQVLPQYLAYLQYTLERNVRSATALGIVGAGGIGMELSGRWSMYDYSHVSTVLIVILVTVMSLERLTQRARAKMM